MHLTFLISRSAHPILTERDAMGSDEYHPISKKGTNLTKAGGIGYTVVDSLDTMLLMGLDDDYQRARKWVEEKLDFDRDAEFNMFEVCPVTEHHKLIQPVSPMFPVADYSECL